jgi:uncharacterized protein (DUF697 family)
MNKKNLPKAIRPTTAHEAGTEPAAPAPEAVRFAPAEPRQPAVEMAKPALPDATQAMERRARAVAVVKRLSLWAGAAGLIPLPVVDLAAVGGVQIEMLRRISKIYEVPFSENSGKALIAGIAGSMIPASSGMGAASLIKGVPLLGTAVSAVAMPTLSVGATYAIGMAFIQHFATGGTMLDFNPPDYSEFLKPAPRKGPSAAAQTA